jgi:hypothetical protein
VGGRAPDAMTSFIVVLLDQARVFLIIEGLERASSRINQFDFVLNYRNNTRAL